MIKNIIISGYFGFDNFGDEAVLKTLITSIKKNDPDTNITVITSNTEKTANIYNVKTVYTFDFAGILKAIFSSQLFISGGGSVLQDVTSLKSLFYYLFLIFAAKLFGKKVAITAQGIGPISSCWGKIFTKNILKHVDLITVRDKSSLELLAKWGIKSQLTADLVWILDCNLAEKVKNEKITVGVQLRNWKNIDDKKIQSLIASLKSAFDINNTTFRVLALQPKEDLEICKKFCEIFKQQNHEADINFVCPNDIDENINEIAGFDYLIAMRFHAGLVAIRAKVASLMLSYDPKVEHLCTEAKVPFVNINTINEELLCDKINKLKQFKSDLSQKMEIFSLKMTQNSRQNIDLLTKLINEE